MVIVCHVPVYTHCILAVVLSAIPIIIAVLFLWLLSCLSHLLLLSWYSCLTLSVLHSCPTFHCYPICDCDLSYPSLIFSVLSRLTFVSYVLQYYYYPVIIGIAAVTCGTVWVWLCITIKVLYYLSLASFLSCPVLLSLSAVVPTYKTLHVLSLLSPADCHLNTLLLSNLL